MCHPGWKWKVFLRSRCGDCHRQLWSAWETRKSVKTISINKLEVRGSGCSSVSVTSDECPEGKGQCRRRGCSPQHVSTKQGTLTDTWLLNPWYQ